MVFFVRKESWEVELCIVIFLVFFLWLWMNNNKNKVIKWGVWWFVIMIFKENGKNYWLRVYDEVYLFIRLIGLWGRSLCNSNSKKRRNCVGIL